MTTENTDGADGQAADSGQQDGQQDDQPSSQQDGSQGTLYAAARAVSDARASGVPDAITRVLAHAESHGETYPGATVDRATIIAWLESEAVRVLIDAADAALKHFGGSSSAQQPGAGV